VGVWPIAFEGNPFVPIVKGIGALLSLDDLKPGVLPGRLVKMAVNSHKGVFDLLSIGHPINLNSFVQSASLLNILRRMAFKFPLTGGIRYYISPIISLNSQLFILFKLKGLLKKFWIKSVNEFIPDNYTRRQVAL